jgi:uncharacterized membrane protein YgcG
MFGGIIGFLIGLVLWLTDTADGLWMLWGTLIGILCEVSIRVGAGEELADAIANCTYIAASDSSSGSDYSNGDSGGYSGSDSGSSDGGGGGE